MKLLRSILWAAALFACAMASEGFADGCKWAGGGFGYGVVRDTGGDKLVYRVSSAKSRWKLESLGWHASATITCEDCGPGSIVRGLIWVVAARRGACTA
jgi:hypothetical protein